jgi:two-component system, NtrC family, nitrogen regulation response regulator NtrX
MKILLVCRARLYSALIIGCLNQAGHDVHRAPDGEPALAQLEEEQYDLLLTDMNLSPMNGLELVEKAKAVQKQLATIVFSHHVNEALVESAKTLAVYRCVSDGDQSPEGLVRILDAVADLKSSLHPA